MLSAVAAVALTVWMLPRGETFSGYDLGPGGFVALAAAVAALVPAVPRPSRRYA